MELNEYQKAAVLDESPVCLVRANVGSGKTTVLIEKIRYFHEKKGVPLERMTILTFTNKAADEIGQRLQESGNNIGTFHSVAFHLLQEELPLEELGYAKEFEVCLPEEELQLAEQLIAKQKLKIKYKNRLQKRLEEFYAKGKTKDYKDDFLKLAELLTKEKKRQNKMSYEDLLKNTVLLLKRHPEFKRPAWIIIDEIQDCDERQLEMIQELKGPETRIFAVGDPNQVIYSWRGSVFNIFYRLKALYQAKELSLPVNYRSSGTILKAAARFQETGMALEGTREQGEKITIRNHYDPFQEALYLADKIKGMHAKGVPYEEIAIFYRLQSQSETLKKVFEEKKVSCWVSQKEDGQENTEKLENAVNLMTLHASKGLEFSHVFIIGVNNGLIPLNPKKEAEEEEERRLFYVGLTRAKESLELSYYTSPGPRVLPGPGRYLSYFPESLVNRTSALEMRDRKEAAEHLQNLKRMILEERENTFSSEPELAEAQKAEGEEIYKEADLTGENLRTETSFASRRVSHLKYGQGSVVSEDENTITVNFDDYGEKELLKAFSMLEEL